MDVPAVLGVDNVRVRSVGARHFVDATIDVAALARDGAGGRRSRSRRRSRSAQRLKGADVTIQPQPVSPSDETVRDRVLLVAQRESVAVHHITIQHLNERLALALDLEVDGALAAGRGARRRRPAGGGDPPRVRPRGGDRDPHRAAGAGIHRRGRHARVRCGRATSPPCRRRPRAVEGLVRHPQRPPAPERARHGAGRALPARPQRDGGDPRTAASTIWSGFCASACPIWRASSSTPSRCAEHRSGAVGARGRAVS